MKEIVYIETTIPSFYYDERPDCIRRRNLTREWWDTQRKNFQCYTSFFTLLETQKTEYPNKDGVISLVNELDLLTYTEYADEINEII